MPNTIQNKKIVYIDGSPLVNNPHAGIGQYTTELIKQLYETPGIRIIIILFHGEEVQISKEIGIEVERLPMPRRVYSFLWKFILQVNVRVFLKFKDPDFIIYPNFATSPYIRAKNTKIMTVIHDLTFIHYPHTVTKKNKYFLLKAVKRSSRLSNHLFFPSKFSRNDFNQRYKSNALLHVAYPGYAKDKHIDPIRESIFEICKAPFLLFLGTIEPRKNLDSLSSAYLNSNFYADGIPLVLAGKVGWGECKIPTDDKIIRLGTVTNAERTILLNQSIAFIFPSIFEGFGMPIIEAMQHKRPVIASLNSSMTEIVNKDNAYCIDAPFKEAEIIAELNTLHSDIKDSSKILKNKIETAYTDSTYFTWQRCADIYIQIIKT